MKPDALSLPPNPKKLKVIYGWYIYVIYSLLVFNIYMAVYNVCVRHPIEAPLLSLFIIPAAYKLMWLYRHRGKRSQ